MVRRFNADGHHHSSPVSSHWQWLLLLGMGILGGLSPAAIAEGRSQTIAQSTLTKSIPVPAKTFRQWCVNRATLSTAQQQTIDALLDSAKTQDCEAAHAYLHQVQGLTLTQKNLTDLSPLASLPHLKNLSLVGNQTPDISPLSQLTNLQFLILSFSGIEDVQPLANLKKLKTLILDNNNIQDLSPLRHLQLNSLIALNNPLQSKRCPLYPVTKCVFSDEGAPLLQDAIALTEQGQLSQARDKFNEAKVLYEVQDDPLRLGNVLNHLADLDLTVGRYANAIQGYEQAIALRHQLGDLPGIGTSLVQQAQAFEQLGLFEQAEENLIQATQNSERQWQLGIPLEGGLYELPKDTGALYRNLAIIQNRLGKAPEALQSTQFALRNYDLLPEGYAGKRVGHQATLAVRGQTLQALGLFSRAEESLQEALQLARTHQDGEGMGQILTLLGDLASKTSNPSLALDYFQEALEHQQALGNLPAQGKTLHLLGTLQLQQGEAKRATRTLLSAVEIWESLRPGLSDENKVALFETQLASYEQLQAALLAQNKAEEALVIAERGRARAFVELVASQVRGEVSSELNQAEPPSIEQIRETARTQNATLVEYSIVGELLVIWVIQPNGEISVRTQNLQQFSQSLDQTAERSRIAASTGSVRGTTQDSEHLLTEIVQENRQDLLESESTRSAIADRPSSVRKKNRRLRSTYELLIEPIADLLSQEAEERVVIIPQGPLFLVPFAALQDEQGRYLIEKHTLGLSPAISVLDLTHQINTGQTPAHTKLDGSEALIVGNPTMPSIPLAYGASPAALSPLPGAEKEAIAIASLLQTEALIGNEAKESRVVEQMKTASVVHLATHGLLDELRYMGIEVPGAIALTPEGDAAHEDGLLTSAEILEMRLAAKLVVLSACNTGRGDITGDGVIGLSRSFIAAGVPSVVVSLWAVPDAPTATLMQAFYQRLNEEPDKAKALRLAMLDTMEEYPQPQNWGAFILIGEAL